MSEQDKEPVQYVSEEEFDKRVKLLTVPHIAEDIDVVQQSKFAAEFNNKLGDVRARMNGRSDEEIESFVQLAAAQEYKKIKEIYTEPGEKPWVDTEHLGRIGGEALLATATSYGDVGVGWGHAQNGILAYLVSGLKPVKQAFQFIFSSPNDEGLGVLDGKWWAQKWENAGKTMEDSRKVTDLVAAGYSKEAVLELVQSNNKKANKVIDLAAQKDEAVQEERARQQIGAEEQPAQQVGAPRPLAPAAADSSSTKFDLDALSQNLPGGPVDLDLLLNGSIDVLGTSEPVVVKGPRVKMSWEDVAAATRDAVSPLDGSKFVNAREFGALDANNDGKLSRDEIPEQMQNQFDAMLAKQPLPNGGEVPTELALGVLPSQGVPLADFKIEPGKEVETSR